MTRSCEITGKKPLVGNNVSHSKRRTKRRFLPNLFKHKFWSESLKSYIQLKISKKGMKTIDKYGVDYFLQLENENNN